MALSDEEIARIARTPIFVDTPENADWTKVNAGSFDVRVYDDQGRDHLARDVEELAQAMGTTVAEVQTLPVYKGATRYWREQEAEQRELQRIREEAAREDE